MVGHVFVGNIIPNLFGNSLGFSRRVLEAVLGRLVDAKNVGDLFIVHLRTWVKQKELNFQNVLNVIVTEKSYVAYNFS